MGKWIREVIIGASAAILILALIYGFDFSLFVLPLSLVLLVGMLLRGRAPFSSKFTLAGVSAGSSDKIAQITFDDIGGQDMAKREFLEALAFLKETKQTEVLGIRPIKGVLLSGPPGTGKTLMAKAAATYTDSVFVSASGSQFVQMYAGVGASRVRQLFKQARTVAEQEGKSKAIIFIDEIDVLGAKRGQNQSHMEYDQTLNELLTQFDGVESEYKVQVLVVGATNRSDLLDPALLRPGRFDRVVQVDLPDKAGRLHILQIHKKDKPLASDVCLDDVAAETYGFSGAHLENLLNEAAINALRRDQSEIYSVDIREAIDKVMLGEKSNRNLKKDELERVAFHEVGHAIISEYVRPGSIASITITPRNNALGYIRQTPKDDKYLYTKDELEQAIQVTVAGTVVEELIFGQRSTGAQGDIDQATDLAKRMVFAGLSSMGIVSTDLPTNKLHEMIVLIIKEQEKIVYDYLQNHLPMVKAVAKRLLEDESINGEKFRSLLSSATVS